MKQVNFLFTVATFAFVLMVSTITAGEAKLEKIEKVFPVKTQEVLFITLKIDAGEICVHKGEQPDKVYVLVQYDDRSDEVDVDYDERSNELFISFDRNKWFTSWDDHRAPKLEVSLPLEVEIELSSRIKAGEIDFNLGSLKIKEFELRNLAGEVNVDFPTPNKIEMELLDINVKIGETKLRRLSNAKFQRAQINGGIGELDIDFSGEGLQSCRAEIDLDIGETIIALPRELGIRFDSSTFGFLTQSNIDYELSRKGRYYYSKNYKMASKTMDFSISSGIGELRVIHR